MTQGADAVPPRSWGLWPQVKAGEALPSPRGAPLLSMCSGAGGACYVSRSSATGLGNQALRLKQGTPPRKGITYSFLLRSTKVY